MMTNRPCAASIPPIKAAPYPRSATCTSRAPSSLAIAGESSVLPLSATTTSPAIPAFLIAASAFRMHVASVSASLRQGITTVTSIGVTGQAPCGREGNGSFEHEVAEWRFQLGGIVRSVALEYSVFHCDVRRVCPQSYLGYRLISLDTSHRPREHVSRLARYFGRSGGCWATRGFVRVLRDQG